jgi:hypothetical protein
MQEIREYQHWIDDCLVYKQEKSDIDSCRIYSVNNDKKEGWMTYYFDMDSENQTIIKFYYINNEITDYEIVKFNHKYFSETNKFNIIVHFYTYCHPDIFNEIVEYFMKNHKEIFNIYEQDKSPIILVIQNCNEELIRKMCEICIENDYDLTCNKREGINFKYHIEQNKNFYEYVDKYSYDDTSDENYINVLEKFLIDCLNKQKMKRYNKFLEEKK